MTPLFDVPPERVRFFGVGAKRKIEIETVAEALDGYVRSWSGPGGASILASSISPVSIPHRGWPAEYIQ